MITVIDNVQQLRNTLTRVRGQNKRIALVPTMGNLHAGHISLIRTAHELADFVMASIFVNPMQFGPSEDLDSYPRTFEEDKAKLAAIGCELVFAPRAEEMYPNGMDAQTRITVPLASEGLEGDCRPGHFTGVATVVCKLFNMVQPDVAIFGEKDYQQLAVIRKMADDLNLPVEIIGSPTVRAEDGLALSSRNGYLNGEQRAIAPVLHQTLRQLADAIREGRKDYGTLEEEGKNALLHAGLRPDYLEICNQTTLKPAAHDDDPLVILVAAFLGTTRLIDNLNVRLPTH